MRPAEQRELAHRGDAASSKAAAHDHVQSGRSAKHKQLVWELLVLSERRTGAPATAGEIHALTLEPGWYGPKFDVVSIRRRLFDLGQDGRALRHPVRKCNATGRPQMTWLTVRQTKLALTENVGGGRPTRRQLAEALAIAETALGFIRHDASTDSTQKCAETALCDIKATMVGTRR